MPVYIMGVPKKSGLVKIKSSDIALIPRVRPVIKKIDQQFAELPFDDACLFFEEIKKNMQERIKEQFNQTDKKFSLLKEFSSKHQL